MIAALKAMETLKQDWVQTEERENQSRIPVRQLGDYHLLREVGRGGMGIVFEALQESLDRRVALKLLPRHVVTRESHVRRLQREARTAAGLHHSNIIPVFDVGEDDGYHYIIMQLIEGVSMDRVLALLRRETTADLAAALPTSSVSALGEMAASRLMSFLPDGAVTAPIVPVLSSLAAVSSLPPTLSHVSGLSSDEEQKPEGRPQTNNPDLPSAFWPLVAHIGLQIADAVHYAHTNGVLHRDIKPGNVMLDQKGSVWIGDFGLAHASDGSNVTDPGSLAGTINYMAPEHFSGTTDERSDIYAIGLTLYELATLTPAVRTGTRAETLRRASEADIPRPGSIVTELPHDLETVILKAIAFEPKNRYQSASELARDLQRFIDDVPVKARRVSQTEKLWRWCRRNPALATATALACSALLTAVIAIGFAWRNESRRVADMEDMLQITNTTLNKVFDQFTPSSPESTSWGALSQQDREANSHAILSPEAASLLEDLLPVFDRLSGHFEDEEIRVRAAEADRRIGDSYRQLGHADAAVEAYQNAIHDYEDLAPIIGQDEVDLSTARLHNRIGNALRDLRREVEARRAFESAINTLVQVDDNGWPVIPEDALFSEDVRLEVAWSCFYMGRRLPPGANGRIVRPTRPGPPAPNRSLPDIDHQAWLQTGISQLETLLNDQQDPKHRFLLALCLRDYGRGFNNVHEQRAIEILRALSVQEPDSATYQFELANTLRDFPFHRLQKVHQDVALRRLREASEILQKLVTADPTQHSYRFILADLFHRRADVVAQQARGLSGVASESALSEAEILSELAFQNHQDAFRGAGFSVTASQGLTRILAAHLEILFGNGRTPHAILTLERMRHVMADETLRMDNEEKELVQQHMEFLQTRFYGDPENGITGIVPPGRAHGGRGPRPEFRSDSANRNERTPAQQRAGDR